MISPFKWKCVILDDHLGEVRSIVDAFRAMGMDCVAGPSRGKRKVQRIGAELALQLCDAHIVFLDMKWDGEGSGDSDAALKGLEDRGLKSPDEFRTWNAAYSSDGSLESGDRGDDLVGYTLGAGISQLNPHAHLVFFSTGAPESWPPSVRTLQYFKPAPYRIRPKEVKPAKERACQAIVSFLEDILSHNPEFHRWLVG